MFVAAVGNFLRIFPFITKFFKKIYFIDELLLEINILPLIKFCRIPNDNKDNYGHK